MSGPSPSPTFPTGPKDNKQWRCIQCDGTLPQSRLLETHAVDTDHKAYRCTKEKACGKLFALRSSWIRHERSHSAKKAHACSRCGKKFHRKDNCHDHGRTCGRVVRRARRPSQSASTSPATSGTTRSGTPMDTGTIVLDEGILRYQTEPGRGGLWPFDHSDASHEDNNGHNAEKAGPSTCIELSVQNGPPLASPAAYLSPTAMAPPQSRTAGLQARTATHPPQAKHNTLLTLDNIEDHTTSRNTTSHRHVSIDWFQWYHNFQSQDAAPSPDLQHTEEHWDFGQTELLSLTPMQVTLTSRTVHHFSDFTIQDSARVQMGDRLHYGHLRGSALHEMSLVGPPLAPGRRVFGKARSCDSRNPQHLGNHPSGVDRLRYNGSKIRDDTVVLPSASATMSPWLHVPDQETVSNPNKDINIPESSKPKPESKPPGKMAKLPESMPRSKIIVFLSKLKEYIKAPFRSYKQWQHGWWTTAMISGVGFAYIAFKKLF